MRTVANDGKIYYLRRKVERPMIEGSATRRLPIGIQSFEEIRTDGYVYVDKTDLVWEMANGKKSNFFSRPRRFGKSLLLSTLQCYFEGRKELFQGLKIMDLEKEWISRPVFRFDFSGAMTAKELEGKIDFILREYEKEWEIEDRPTNPGDRMLYLIKTARTRSGQKAAVLVDEYDFPLQHTLFDESEHSSIANVYTSFFPALKTADELLKCVFITGITKFTHQSLFSILNNLTVQSLSPKYATVCGMTHNEIVENFSPELQSMAKVNGWSMEETLSRLKEEYDGYFFSTGQDEGIYNPFSVINALDSGKIASYWAFSGASELLSKMLMESFQAGNELDGVEIGAGRFELQDVSLDNIPLFLYQTGYLTIKGYDDGIYTLGFPNREVKSTLYEILLPSLVGKDASKVDSSIKKIKGALRQSDIEEVMLNLRQLIAETPYASKGYKPLEERFQFIVVQTFYMCGCKVDEHRKVAGGEIDVVVHYGNLILVMELKVGGEKAVDKGCAQAHDKGYLDAYCATGKDVYLVAVSFTLAKGKSGISGYKIERIS